MIAFILLATHAMRRQPRKKLICAWARFMHIYLYWCENGTPMPLHLFQHIDFRLFFTLYTWQRATFLWCAAKRDDLSEDMMIRRRWWWFSALHSMIWYGTWVMSSAHDLTILSRLYHRLKYNIAGPGQLPRRKKPRYCISLPSTK